MISQRHRYALLSMVCLGKYYGQDPVQLRIISEEEGIPHAFLEQLIVDLKKAKLVKSTRGAKGGYQLAKSPSGISVKAVLDAIDPMVIEYEASDSLGGFWANLNQVIEAALLVSLQHVIDDSKHAQHVLRYTI